MAREFILGTQHPGSHALSRARLRSPPFKIEDASPRIRFQRDSNPLCSLDHDGGAPVEVWMYAPLMLRPLRRMITGSGSCGAACGKDHLDPESNG
jgi:hypothetical protein